MATFSINQVSHAYVVAGDVTAVSGGYLSETIANTALVNPGDIAVGNAGGISPDKINLWIAQKNAKGEIVRSDVIKPKNILWARYVPAALLQDTPKAYTVAFDSNVNSGNPIVGQDYILTFTIEQFMSPSNEDKYIVHASARAFANDTAADVMGRIASSLIASLNRMSSVPPVTVTDNQDGTMTITENFPYWELGKFQYTRTYFHINPSTVLDQNTSLEVVWGTVTEITSGLTPFHNGAKLADLEYFTLGARGSEERHMGWPYDFNTEGFLTANAKNEDYDVLQIHYYYEGANHSCQKSERDLIFIIDPNTAASEAFYDAITAVFAAAGCPENLVVVAGGD